MADENYGVNDQEEEVFFDSDSKAAELTQKLEALEKEKLKLLHENEEIKGKVENMVAEIDGLKKDKAELNNRLEKMKIEIEVEEEGKNVMDSIAGRAAELEAEVSRLQHDLVQVMTESEDANAEAMSLRKTLEEKEGRLLILEKDVQELRKAKTESEKIVKELERKIGILEVRESELKSEKIRVKEQMREKLDEKEAEVLSHKRKVEDLEFVISKNGTELQKCMKEKKNTAEALRLSEETVRAMELKMVHMQKQVGEAEKAICILKEKTIESVNGIADKEIVADVKGSEAQWPLVAMGSTGVIVAVAAVAFVVYCRQR